MNAPNTPAIARPPVVLYRGDYGTTIHARRDGEVVGVAALMVDDPHQRWQVRLQGHEARLVDGPHEAEADLLRGEP